MTYLVLHWRNPANNARGHGSPMPAELARRCLREAEQDTPHVQHWLATIPRPSPLGRRENLPGVGPSTRSPAGEG